MDIFKRLFGQPSAASELGSSEARFCEAYRLYQDACRRGDTRDQQATWAPLRDARAEQLKAELTVLNRGGAR